MGLLSGAVTAGWSVFLALAVCAGCASVAVDTGPGRHVDLVIEDVSAIIDGMAAAHGGTRVGQQAPDFRSAVPRPTR